MRRLLSASILLGLILLDVSTLVSAPLPTVALIEADVVEIDFDHERTHAAGQARLSYADLELRADQLTADRVTGQVEAAGELELTQAGRRLRGEALEYNLRSSEGVLKKARVAEQGVIITGEEVSLSPRQLVAHHAYFTTCDRPHPHYTFGADRITLTAQEGPPGQRPQSGRLTLDRARVTYHGRRLFTVPHYSVSVGELGEPHATPFPVTGFSRDDGPYASIAYALGRPDDPTLADFSYRYTTLRGIRGHIRLRRLLGPAELTAGYVRREDSADREFHPDELEASLAKVLVDRRAEYGVLIPDFPLGRSLRLRGEWLSGSYSERFAQEEEARASADRVSASVLLSANAYAVSPNVTLSHAVGWRRSSYSPGDRFSVRFYRHSADLNLSPTVHLSLSHITRRDSGETPFLFDGVGTGREFLGDLRWRVNPRWRLRLVDLYDLEAKAARDIIFEVTRTAHCLDYTIGWRKTRGTFFLGIGLATPSAEKER